MSDRDDTSADWSLGEFETGESESTHRIVNPPTLPPPLGFSHAVVAAAGRTVWLGGQAAHARDGTIGADDLVEQFDAAAANLTEALRAAGGRPEHLVSLQIFTTDAAGYRSNLGPIGEAYRKHLGRHFPATGLFEVKGLFDPRAKIELMAVAVIPD
jgi:enamine deaminase RidA (YjgF/YER057c/UK114 family)